MPVEQARELELSSVIDNLRQELEAAQATSMRSSMRFEVTEIEVEVSIQVARSKQGRSGLNVYVVEAGGSASTADASVQRVRLTLKPPEDFRIAGEGLAR